MSRLDSALEAGFSCLAVCVDRPMPRGLREDSGPPPHNPSGDRLRAPIRSPSGPQSSRIAGAAIRTLVERAVALGWSRDQVVIIDNDQGKTARTAAQRSGFQRILAEVTMEHVGLILGIEMSRIARNNRDWHNLLEMCAMFGTILADEDGVYDPKDTNDRLLLGLKGTISEFELVTMRNRLERGRLHKAQRGALFHNVPTGYVKLSSERVEMDPDEQVRDVIRLVFDKYDELGTSWGVFPIKRATTFAWGFARIMGPTAGTWSGVARTWRPSFRSFATRSTRVPMPMAVGRTNASGRPRENAPARATGSPWSSGRF